MSKDFLCAERYPTAILGTKVLLQIETIPERVDLPISMELCRNGATAKKSLPKTLSAKNGHG
jgi:hypothetical protein